MKNILLVIISIASISLLISCKTAEELQPTCNLYAFDFSKYAGDNFLFSPWEYTGEYKSIGLLTLEFFPGVKKYYPSALDKKPHRHQQKVDAEWVVENFEPSEAIDSLYIRAKNMGADAIMNFDIKPISKTDGDFLLVDGIRITGFAIKRK